MKRLIFQIEDDASTLEVYEIALEQAGFEVDTVESGEEALERLKLIKKGDLRKPDLILLDYLLPGIDGLDVLQNIRKDPKLKNLKVFITSNYSVRELKDKGEMIKGEKVVLKADYPPTKMVELIKDELDNSS